MSIELVRTVWDLIKQTWTQWNKHRSAEMAAALAFYGAVSLAGLALIALYAVSHMLAGGGGAAYARGQTLNVAGAHNAYFLGIIQRQALSRHNAWIAVLAGSVFFVVGVLASALQLQQILDVVWDARRGRRTADQAKRHAPQFAAILLLVLILLVCLFAGAAVHALTSHTHRLPAGLGILYQALVIGVTIVVLTFVFLFIFAYLPPADVPWRKVWIASFVSAVLYERGQFALSVYLGQMDATSPYADLGVVLAIVIWLYYSAQVLLVGADFTKVLKERGTPRRVKSPG